MLEAGAARLYITPPLPFDIQPNWRGHCRNGLACASRGARFRVLRSDNTHVVVVTADSTRCPPRFLAPASGISVSSAIGCRPEQVLINFSHSHAAPAPYFAYKLGSAHESLDHLAAERAVLTTNRSQCSLRWPARLPRAHTRSRHRRDWSTRRGSQ